MNKTRLCSLLCAIPLLNLLPGCATLTRGTTETYRVVSDPPGALATLSTGETCTTPCAIDKKRDESFQVTIEKTGYDPYLIQVNPESCKEGSMAMFCNLFMIGSLLWASIDSLSGASRGLSPNPAMAVLVPTAFPTTVASPLPATSKDSHG